MPYRLTGNIEHRLEVDWCVLSQKASPQVLFNTVAQSDLVVAWVDPVNDLIGNCQGNRPHVLNVVFVAELKPIVRPVARVIVIGFWHEGAASIDYHSVSEISHWATLAMGTDIIQKPGVQDTSIGSQLETVLTISGLNTCQRGNDLTVRVVSTRAR